jgi:hypothetical protein
MNGGIFCACGNHWKEKPQRKIDQREKATRYSRQHEEYRPHPIHANIGIGRQPLADTKDILPFLDTIESALTA